MRGGAARWRRAVWRRRSAPAETQGSRGVFWQISWSLYWTPLTGCTVPDFGRLPYDIRRRSRMRPLLLLTIAVFSAREQSPALAPVYEIRGVVREAGLGTGISGAEVKVEPARSVSRIGDPEPPTLAT